MQCVKQVWNLLLMLPRLSHKMCFIKKLSIVSVALILSACSHIYGDNGVITSRDTTYLKAKTTPPLKIPPGISSSSIHSEYPIPDRNYSDDAKRVRLAPPEL